MSFHRVREMPRAVVTTLLVTMVTALLTALMTVAGVTPASATPPGIPSTSTATSELAALTVAAWTHTDTYDRDLFPTWDTISGTCNTRETVLKRDGTNVVTDSSCAAVSGSWYSPYDGATWTAASDLDIDHVVPLKNAWISGAWAWTTAKRESFANDLTDPQLIAVTDNVNQAKSDQSPDSWKPPLSSYWCTYAKMWIQVKYVWALTVTSAEKSALSSMLSSCSGSGGGSTCTASQLLGNNGFESGNTTWSATSGVITNSTSESARTGSYYAWLDGYGSSHTDTLSQSVTIPSGCTATLSFYLHIDTAETTTSTAYDVLTVKAGSTTLATFSNLNAASGYTLRSYDVSSFAGSTVTISFSGVEGSTLQTSFVIDDTSLTTA